MWRAREVTFERRRKRARWWRTSPLSCSIGKVRSLPTKCRSSGINRRKPSHSSVTKTCPSMPILSRSRRQVASSRPPSSQARARRATGSKARQIQTLLALVGFRGGERGLCDQTGDEGAEERLAPAPGVVHELEEGEVGRQLLLRDASARPEPGAQQGPQALGGV